MYLVLAFLLGIAAGLRSFTPLAAVSWAAHLGALRVTGTPLAFMGARYVPILLSICAIGELIADKLPQVPSRKKPGPFIVRILSGALTGSTVGAALGSLPFGLIAGAVGAVIGTLGGAAARARMAAQFHKDLPAALIEDAVTIGISIAVVLAF